MSTVFKNRLVPLLYTSNSHVPGIICLVITVGILAACLWPFSLNPANKVSWLQNENGIRFYGLGIVFSPEPLKIPGTASRTDAVTIELLVRPGKGSGYSWGSILTLYNHDREQFILGQWKTNFNVRVPASNSNVSKSYRHLGIVNALPKETIRLITVTSGKDETDIYVNGKLEESAPHYALIQEDQGLSGYLVLGNSPEGTNPWSGDLLGLAVYGRLLNNKEISDHYRAGQDVGRPVVRLQADKPINLQARPIALYFFDEHNGQLIRDHSGAGNQLLAPAVFHPLRKTVLIAPWNDNWYSYRYVVDIIVNILGFVPFGFFLSAWLRYSKNLPAARVYGITILLGFCLSFVIELAQAFIPTRGSQLMDIFTNTVGTALGPLLLFKYVAPTLQKNKK